LSSEEQDSAAIEAWAWPTATKLGKVVCLSGSKADADTASCQLKDWDLPEPQNTVRR
jgi:hypothetical protein